jgi:hypothetical protein
VADRLLPYIAVSHKLNTPSCVSYKHPNLIKEEEEEIALVCSGAYGATKTWVK